MRVARRARRVPGLTPRRLGLWRPVASRSIGAPAGLPRCNACQGRPKSTPNAAPPMINSADEPRNQFRPLRRGRP
jgi:hypothetical protein